MGTLWLILTSLLSCFLEMMSQQLPGHIPITIRKSSDSAKEMTCICVYCCNCKGDDIICVYCSNCKLYYMLQLLSITIHYYPFYVMTMNKIAKYKTNNFHSTYNC